LLLLFIFIQQEQILAALLFILQPLIDSGQNMLMQQCK
jgi:hypothetical protein